MKFLLLILLVFLFRCGLFTCVSEVPEEVVEKNKELAETTNISRLNAVEAERARLNVRPVKLHEELGFDMNIGQSIFPKAVPHFLDGASEKYNSEGYYSEFHGYEGALTVFETEPGSKIYFIIDEVRGDGAGSIYQSQIVEGTPTDGSMHSWHVTADNGLVRAQITPNFTSQQTVSLCSCGFAKMAPSVAAAFPRGIFLLPAGVLPVLLSEEMNVKYKDESIKIQRVNSLGNLCPAPVC